MEKTLCPPPKVSWGSTHTFKTMLVWYIGECMVAIININSGIKTHAMGIEIVIPIKYWYLVGGHVKVRENLCISKLLLFGNTILNHMHIRAVLLRYGGSCMVYRPKCCQKWKSRQTPIRYCYQKYVKSSLEITKWYQKMTIPDHHLFKHIHLIQNMSYDPADCFTRFFNDMHNLFPNGNYNR